MKQSILIAAFLALAVPAHAQLGGLKPFLVGVGPTNGLDFGLIYPEPAKPQVKNVAAAANAGSK